MMFLFAILLALSFSQIEISNCEVPELSTPAAIGSSSTLREASNTTMSKTFMYFAYGSNLLTKRLHLQNPSAVKYGCGKLKNYKLDFNYYSKRWRGAAATIIPVEGANVWGAIYEINSEHLQTLDAQEGVPEKIYFSLTVDQTQRVAFN